MKYWKALLPLLSLAVLLLFPSQSEAASPIQLYLNGQKLNPEVAPRIVNDITIVPLRIIAEELGAKVSWFQEERRVRVEQGSTVIDLKIEKPAATVNGKPYTLEAAPVIVEGNTLVPIRFVAEQLGVKVGWDNLTRSVSLYKQAQDSASSGNGAVNGGENPSGTDAGNGSPTGNSNGTGSGSAGNTDGSAGNTGKPAGGTLLNSLVKLETSGDQLVIETTGDTAPTSFMLSDPYRIVVDLPGVSLAGFPKAGPEGKSGEMQTQHPLIQKIRFAQYSEKPLITRVVIDLKQKADYKLTENKAARQILLGITTEKIRVVIDAGHGGSDPGAISVNSRQEKDFTLAVATKVYALLQQVPEIQAYMTRTDDTYPTLQDRVDLANKLNAHLFISIHGNKHTSSTSGTETYYSRPDSEAFANLVHRKVVEAAGFPDRKVRRSDFKVIRDTVMPAVLLEIGYLSNSRDESLMFSDDFQSKVAASIVAAIKEYFQIK